MKWSMIWKSIAYSIIFPTCERLVCIFNFIFSFLLVYRLDELGLPVHGKLALHDGEVDQVLKK